MMEENTGPRQGEGHESPAPVDGGNGQAKPKKEHERQTFAKGFMENLREGFKPGNSQGIINNGIMIGNTVASGDIASSFSISTSQSSSQEVDASSLKSAEMVFNSADTDGIVSRLRSSHFAVLHGAEDRGARQIAYAALTQVLPGKRIVELAEASDWARIKKVKFDGEVGYTVSLTGSNSGFDRERRQLQECLVECGAYLVVRRSIGHPENDDLKYDSWVLDPAIILERLLRQASGGDGQDKKTQQLLANEEIRQALTQLVNYPAVERLAAGLRGTFSEGALDISGVIADVLNRGEQSLIDWLERNRSTELRCHLLATAVLDGLPWSNVVDAAQMLWRRLSPKEAMEKNSADFGLLRDEIISKLEASVHPVSLRLDQVQVTVDGVRLHDRRWTSLAFGVAVSRFSGAREALLAWLRELAAGDELLRENIGRVVATLAARDFPDALRNLLTPWADSEDVGHCLTVAAAFDAYSQPFHENSTQLAVAVLKHWLNGPSSPRLTRTALNVLARAWGWRHRQQTLDLLEHWSKSVGEERYPEIFYILDQLVKNGSDAQDGLALVLARCRAWKRHVESGQGANGQQISLGDMFSLGLILNNASSLLRLLGERVELYEMVNEVLAKTARRQEEDVMRELALNCLTEQVEWAYRIPEYRENLRRLLAIYGLADEQNLMDRRRLASHLKSKTHGKPFAKFAASMAEQLLRAPIVLGGKNV